MNREITWRWAEPPIDRDLIRDVENRWGVNLPLDYVAVAQQYHGGQPSPECLVFDDEEQVLGSLLPFISSVNMTINDVYEAVLDRLPEGIFPFADDPFDNLYCFDYRTSSNPTVVYWNHELSVSEPEGCVLFVASSFTALLEMLTPCGE